MTIVLWPKYCKLADYECIARSKQRQCNQLVKQDTLLKLKQRLMRVLPVVRGTPNTTMRTDHIITMLFILLTPYLNNERVIYVTWIKFYLINVYAVSYTHLDVYKRQTMRTDYEYNDNSFVTKIL